MQQSPSYTIKPFTCPFHPSEEILRVCLDLSSKQSLQCIECILHTTRKMPKDKFCQIADFVNFAAEQYKTGEGSPSFQEPPPSSLVDFLAYEERKMKTLTNHIEREKQRVQDNFNSLLKEFTLLCHNTKEKVLSKLDMQLVFLRNNYTIYKSKIDKYYHNNSQKLFDKDSLITQINQCKDTQEMEILVKDLKEDNLQWKAEEIQADLKNFAQELIRESNTTPRSPFSDISSSIEKIIEEVKNSLEKFSEIQDPVGDIFGRNLPNDSKIVTELQDADLIRKWLRRSAKNTQPRLLYRGSRDGFDAKIFHEKCDSSEETLIIAKTTAGYIFGGFSDQSWQGNHSYKTSNHCWLFSMNHRDQYPIKKNNNTHAIYAHPTYGPTFGSGHDLFINLALFNSNGSYSKLGQAYEYDPVDPSERQTRLTGNQQFILAEIEVFAIYGKYSRPIASKNFDSLILDPVKDLQLLQRWASKLRNIDVELLYRGSRDGFNAKDFHTFCDNQGPTIVVCKSADSGRVFGGYTSQNWSKLDGYVSDKDAFLFSITSRTKHTIKDREHAIYCNGDTGPIFGEGFDLFIAGESDKDGECTSVLGMTYKANETVCDLTKYLAGEAKFSLQEIEVFKITDETSKQTLQ